MSELVGTQIFLVRNDILNSVNGGKSNALDGAICKNLLQHQEMQKPGPSCSKLMTSLVNVLLKFQTLILQIHCYFFVEKNVRILNL